jgi:hypothetical protein
MSAVATTLRRGAIAKFFQAIVGLRPLVSSVRRQRIGMPMDLCPRSESLRFSACVLCAAHSRVFPKAAAPFPILLQARHCDTLVFQKRTSNPAMTARLRPGGRLKDAPPSPTKVRGVAPNSRSPKPAMVSVPDLSSLLTSEGVDLRPPLAQSALRHFDLLELLVAFARTKQ